MLEARISATVRRLAPRDDVSDPEAAAELREVAGGRSDLLAHVAGLAYGAHPRSRADWPWWERAYRLCLLAGAGPPELVDRWIDIGRSRAARPRPQAP